MSGKSIVSSRNATRVKGLKYVGTLADGEVWVFQSSSGNMIPGSGGGGGGDSLDNTPDLDQPTLPPYKDREGETFDKKKARIIYQSRKRGMLENDLVLR